MTSQEVLKQCQDQLAQQEAIMANLDQGRNQTLTNIIALRGKIEGINEMIAIQDAPPPLSIAAPESETSPE